MLEPGIHFNIPRADYDADPGYNQSTLKKFGCAPTPLDFKTNRDKKPAPTDEMIIGSYVDASLMAGDLSKFVVHPSTYPAEPTKKDPRTEKPWNRGADFCKAWEAERAAAGKLVLSPEDHIRAERSVLAARANSDFRDTLACCDYQVVVIAIHPTLGYRMKGCLDLYPKVPMRWAWDCKTGYSAHTPLFKRSANQTGLHIQAEYYRRLLLWCPENVYIDHFGFLVVETDEPHGVRGFFFRKDQKEMHYAAGKIDQWLPAYDKCVTEDNWPGYPSSWVKLDYAPWMLKDDVEHVAE